MHDPLVILALLGLAALAGIRLYAVVLLLGVLARCDGFHLVAIPAGIQPFGSVLVLAVAGVLALLEFCVDKIAWVDLLWDGFSMFVRPLGGALIMFVVASHDRPVVRIALALFGGVLALLVHAAKTSVRAEVHAGASPTSTLVVSLGEDLLALVGVLAVLGAPPLSLLLLGLTFVLGLYFLSEWMSALAACYRRLIGRVPLQR